MEDNFDQNEFEEFLQDQVRNHKMYPSDAVWRDINKKLHGDKRWPALTVAAFTLIGAAISICAYFFPKPNIFAGEATTAIVNSTQPVVKNDDISGNLTSPNSLLKEKSKSAVLFNTTSGNDALTYSEVNNRNSSSTEGTPDGHLPSFSENNQEKLSPLVSLKNNPKNSTLDKAPETHEVVNPAMQNVALLKTPAEIGEKQITNKVGKTVPPSEKPAVAKDYNDKNMVDGFLKENKEDLALYTAKKQKDLKNRLSYQFYIAPSVSYRKLLEDPSILKSTNTAGPVGLNHVADVNKVVRHKPGNGMEAGFAIQYNLSEKFRVKTGFQFNVRQYSIEAYKSNSEVASIALIQNNRIDTVNTVAVYRNNNGFYSAELVNRYYQLAVPVGVEWEVIGNKKVQLNVAGSIQPTYLINRNAYLLSTNYKNYSENPSMVRSWNINSNIEAFISFKVGDFKWQVGPQLRYQPYSTFIPQYPIKEHLLDYGIKVGVSKAF